MAQAIWSCGGALACEQRAREKFAVLLLVEPGAFDIEHLDAGKAGKCECVDGKLSDRLVGPSIGLVVEDVHGAVSDLQKINVPGDRTFSVCG